VRRIARVFLVFTLVCVAPTLVGCKSASAQGFMVKPMRMDIVAPPGRMIEVPLQIRNTAGSEVRAIDLRLAELSQNAAGGWRLAEGDAADEVVASYSSLAWTTLSQQRAEIAPLEPAEIVLRLQVPANARGAYFAAIVAETPMPEDPTGVFVRVRFVIPVIVEIEGRPVRQQVALDDVVMVYAEGAEGNPATTTAGLRVTNQGRTFSRVKGRVAVERQSGERWRPVTRFDLRERPIIPGLSLDLGQDLERRLPSGTYRLRGELSVDGRRIAPLEKEIVFEGDPNIDALAYDTALILEPAVIDMSILPGATRTTAIRIQNPGSDPVKVSAASSTPQSLIGVELRNVTGSMLSAAPWTEVVPAEFTIRPGGRQNIRVISRVPKQGVHFPHYYADLTLSGTYADGQSAGETRSMVHLAHAGAESVVGGAVETMSLAEADDPGQFFAQLRFANLGNTHVTPAVRLFLLNAQGGQMRNTPLAGEEGLLLPLAKRTFSGSLDLKNIEPGYYALRGVIDVGDGKRVVGQRVVRVDEPQGEGAAETMAVTLIDPQSANVPEEFKDMEKAGEGGVAPAPTEGAAPPAAGPG